jgi:hypothetical protein
MATTVETFRTSLMQEFGLAEDNDNEGTSSSAILKYIHEANADFINYRAWTFQREIYTVTLPADSTVATQFTTAAASIVLGDTSAWPATGRVLVDYDLITFTANDLTDTLTVTASTINRTHLVGERAIICLAMPTNFSKIGNVKINGRFYMPEDVRLQTTPSPTRFWEFKEKTSGVITHYLAFAYSTQARTAYMTYYKAPQDLQAATPSTSYLDIPEDFDDYVNHAVSARIYRHLEEMNLAREHEEKSAQILKRAAIFDSKQHNGIRIPVRTAWDNPEGKLLNNGYRIRR